MQENLSQDELSVQFAQFTAAQEKSQSQEVGKSRQVTVSRRPLLEPQSQGWVWAGNVAGALARIGVLFKAQEQKELTSKQWCIVESLLQSLEQVEVEFESLVWKDFLCKLWQTVEQKARIEP